MAEEQSKTAEKQPKKFSLKTKLLILLMCLCVVLGMILANVIRGCFAPPPKVQDHVQVAARQPLELVAPTVAEAVVASNVPASTVSTATASTSTVVDAKGGDVPTRLPAEKQDAFPRVEKPAQDRGNRLYVAGICVLLLFIIGMVVWGRNRIQSKRNRFSTPSEPEKSKRALFTFGQDKALETDIPTEYVHWFQGMDQDKLENLIVEERQCATSLFFNHLHKSMPKSGIPKPVDIEDATRLMSNHLYDFATNGLWLETIHGEPLDSEKQSFLSLHLKKLLPKICLSEPSQGVGEIRTIPLCAWSALGSFFGFCISGILARLLGVAPEAWMMLGAISGTFGFVLLGLYIANNDVLRKRLMLITGVAAGLDVALQGIKESIPLPFGKSRGSFLKRLALYGAGFICLMLLKRKTAFDIGRYRLETEQLVGQWLVATIPLTRVLARRVKPSADPFNVDLAAVETLRDQMKTLVHTVEKLRQSQGEDRSIVVDELVQDLKVIGYVFGNTPEEGNQGEQIWEESMREIYQPFDLILPGDRFLIEKQPIIFNGKVEEKGLVRKWRKRS